MPPVQVLTDQYDLVPTKNYPSYASFPFENFNPVQSRIFEVYDKPANIIIAARTSSGKTVCAEQLLSHEIRVRGGKGLYLAPLKSLAREKIDEWTSEKHHFSDLNLSICTGDYRLTEARQKELANANLIMMTTEMLDSRTKNFKSENNDFLKDIGTVVVDECFPYHTPVRIAPNIEMPIGRIIDNPDVKEVLAYDEATQKVVSKKILRKIRRPAKNNLVAIKHQYGKLVCTEDHKIWTERGYVKAKDLTSNDKLKWVPLDESLICTICGKKHNSIKELRQHYIYKHISIGKNAVHVDDKKECPKCGKSVSVYGFQSHLKQCGLYKAPRYTPKSNICPTCGAVFKDATSRHIHEIHHTFDEVYYAEKGKRLAANSQYIDSMKKMGERRRGKDNPIFRNPESYEKFLLLGAKRWASLSEEEKQQQIERFINAPRNKTSNTSLEIFVERVTKDLPVRRTSGGKRWVTFKNGRRKNPDFEVLNTNKVIEIGDTEYWHTEAEIKNVVQEYAKIGIRCLYLTDKDVKRGDAHVLSLINSFINNHSSQVISVKKWGCHGIKEVYDLEVEDCHNYFARGTLVSNCHLLTVPNRGDKLEVALMKFTQIAPHARIVMLSATMPNVKEIAEWVSYDLTGRETYLINSDYRPCPLGIHWEEYEEAYGYEATEENKIDAALNIINDYPEDKFLIFVHTKKTGERVKAALKRAGIECEFHSADLEKNDRHKIEDKFRSGKLRAIVATSTLAWGCYKYGTTIAMADGSLKKVQSLIEGDEVLSFNDGKYRTSKVISKKRQKTNGLEVTLSTGETVTVTEDHLFYAAINRDTPDWIRASRLKVGDSLAVPSTYNLWSDFDFDPLWYLRGYAFGDGCKTKSGTFADGENKIVVDFTFGNHERKHASKIKTMIEKVSGYEMPKIKIDKSNILHLTSKARCISSLFGTNPLGRKTARCELPVFPSRHAVGSYLRGLFDTDGGVEKHNDKNYSVGFANISRHVVEAVQHYLLCFGVRSSIGRKRMKKAIINGRLQLPKRKYSYRVRIYNSDMIDFQNKIGFSNQLKQRELRKAISRIGKIEPALDFIPARSYLKTHAEQAGISLYSMLGGNSGWAQINKQDVRRSTLRKILNTHPAESDLTRLVGSDIRWSKITKIEPIQEASFIEVSLDNDHTYVGGGVISHNCNFPARRVIVVGVHRGMSEVESYDIFQMIGRAGRVGYDPRGDAYILLPRKKFDYHVERLSTPKKIESQLLTSVGEEDPHYKTLAFHLVSEIHHGDIKDRNDVHDWFERSLAHHQSGELSDDIAMRTIELLVKVGAIKESAGIYEATSIGKVSSMFYYSPFDVADLRRNFKYIFQSDLANNDVAVAMALGNVDSLRMGFVSKDEREEMSSFANQVRKMFGDSYLETAVKGGYVHFALLNGLSLGPFNAMGRGIQFDYDRTTMVLNALDSMAARWDRKEFFRNLTMRIAYGVKTELIDLCRLPDVGKVRAERLYAAGLRTVADVANSPDHAKKILNMKDNKAQEIITAARSMVLAKRD